MYTAGPTPPKNLPRRLTISLWDFSWYTQTASGEPFADLDRAFKEAVERGYNTVRICAAPLLLFGEHGLDTTRLQIANMGGEAGQRTRWYNVTGGEVINGREHLLALFQAAARHDCYVIVSSWEYQQSSAFLADSSWYDMLRAIPASDRHAALARAEIELVAFLKKEGLADRIAYVELHNEVDLSRLAEVASKESDTYWAQRPLIDGALESMNEVHPDVLFTVSYGIPPYLDLAAVPDNAAVAHQHFYIYGVLAALESWAQVRVSPPAFPTSELSSLLREDAPQFADWTNVIEAWRLEATGISTSMFYAYDWVDPILWDRWLYSNFQLHEEAMKRALDARLDALSIWARHHGVPAVVGEGWIGYTPLFADFEDGPIGQGFAEYAVRRCAELGFWGTLPGSNSAPHHPGWANIDFQRRVNRIFLDAP